MKRDAAGETPEEVFARAVLRQKRIHEDQAARRRAALRYRAPDAARRAGRVTGDPSRLSGFLKTWRRASGLGSGAKHDELAAAWAETVGPEIAAKTRVAGFRARVLTVDVDGASLRSELATFHASALLETVRAAVPGARLSKIVFRLSPGRS